MTPQLRIARLGALLLIQLATATTFAQERCEVNHSFQASGHSVAMTVSFQPPYLGKRLVFYPDSDPNQAICFSGDGEEGRCMERFVGAVALVKFTVRRANGKTPRSAKLAERVTVLSQSPGLPERPPFSKERLVVNGVGSDIQAFGYDESSVAERERTVMREAARTSLWRIYRQELYLNEDRLPFATVEWKHTLDGITLLNVTAGPPCSATPVESAIQSPAGKSRDRR